MKAIIAGIVGIVVLAGLFAVCDLNYTDYHEVGLTWSPFSGEVNLQAKAGWHITAPWVLEATLDTRPQRVCITSATRAFNCRLVQFVPSEYRAFAATQGFGYYWWANRISFNFGYLEEYRGFRDILRGYAYGTDHYSFIRILSQ